MNGRLTTWQAAFVIARRDFTAILFSRSFIFFLLPFGVGGFRVVEIGEIVAIGEINTSLPNLPGFFLP